MLIYLVMFFTSVFLIWLSRKIKSKYARVFCIILALLLPALLAGLRDSSIGTDYEVYGIAFYERAVSSGSLVKYLAAQTLLENTDYGFNVLTYLCTLISKDYKFGMFVYQMITVVFVFLGLRNCERKYNTPLWLAMFLYYCTLYNASLNIMRQCIAVAIAFYAFTLVWEKKYVRYAIWTAIAFTMHSSAIIGGLALLIMYLFLQRGKIHSERKQLFRAVILLAVIALAMFGISPLVQMLVNLGVLNTNFLTYLSGGTYSASEIGTSISFYTIFDIAMQGLYTVIYLLYYRYMNRNNKDALFFTMNSALIVIIWTISPFFAKYTFRMSYFFMPLQMVGLANTSLYYKKKESRVIWRWMLIILVVFFWLIYIVRRGSHETTPYLFFWQ